LGVLLAMASVVVVASCGAGAALLSSAASPNQVIKFNAYCKQGKLRGERLPGPCTSEVLFLASSGKRVPISRPPVPPFSLACSRALRIPSR
jgi:hypothetical protein